MNYAVFDIEADGLLETATKIHCMSINEVIDGKENLFTLTSYEQIKTYLLNFTDGMALVGHNIKRYDIPMLEKFIGVDLSLMFCIDTLALSWYLYPIRKKHGLEEWGEEFGVPKPKITDWNNQPLEDYIYRCEQDVRINSVLFDLQGNYLKQIYGEDDPLRIVRYLMFKMDCAYEQECQRWKLDIEKTNVNLNKLKLELEEKTKSLIEVMPRVETFVIKSRPKVCFKKDGSVSEHGKRWFELLEKMGLPDHHLGAVKVITGYDSGNPGSQEQLKQWLFSLGWEPDHYKIVKDENTGQQKRVPQLANPEGTDLSDSVKILFEETPELEALEGYFVLRHRIGILEGFLENVDSEGYLKAQIKGLTNTLRFKHTTIVNLPTIPKPYWEEVRGCLIAEEGFELCGSDMSSLEDNTKQHYMYYFDPDYVREMRTPGFDPHLDIAILSGLLTKEESDQHKLYDKTKGAEGVSHKATRLKAKKVNFACVYGAGVAKIALTAKIPPREAKTLHTTYWIRNKSVKDVANNTIHKTIGEQMWLYNPVSKFWYSLRYDKDKFSTLNQSTGVYCFDTWLRYVRAQKIKLIAQFHDEKISRLRPEQRQQWIEILNKAIDLTNEELQLNVPLKISIDFGKSYADIH